MGGLECSEVGYKKVIESSYSGRFDAEFFTKKAIAFSVLSENWTLLSLICPNIKSGTTPSTRDDNLKHGIALLKTNDIRNNIVDPLSSESFYYIDEQTNQKMRLSAIRDKDVLMNIVGATTDVIGRVSYVPEGFIKANITQAMAKLRVINEDFYPEYLFAFLLTTFARHQTNRIARQTGQFNMNLQETGSFKVWKGSKKLQTNIRVIINKAYEFQSKAQKIYQETNLLLLSTLGLTDFTPTEQQVSVKSLSKSFTKSERLDAEYYQPKYDEYEQLINNYAHGYKRIVDLFTPVKTKCDRTKAEYKYIEIGDVNIGDGSANYNIVDTDELPDNAKIVTKSGDILVSTVRPNRGAVAIVQEDGLLVSGAFTVLRQKFDYPKELLQVLLRTPLYRDWLLKYNVGTSYPVIKDADVLNMPIPLFDDIIRQNTISKVQESFALRRRSEQLLEYAKRAVELAIEEGEEKAMKWLESKGVES